MGQNKSKEEKLFYREVYAKVGKAVHDYGLIEANDRILVGVSGGKDSLTLLVMLAERAKSSKIPYTVVAAHIRSTIANYETDESYLQMLCTSLGVELYCDTITADVREGSGKPMCFVCAWNRRKKLFQIAKEHGCNKLAFGHHKDDAIVSLLMGMFFNGTISSMPAKLDLFGGELKIVRPLIYLSEKECAKFAAYRAFEKQTKSCQYEKDTNRNMVSELIKQLEQTAPDIRESLFVSMQNVRKEYLP